MGQAQLDKIGSVGREDEAKLYRSQVLTILDKEHFLYGKLPTARYDLEDPENQSTLDSIRAVGILQPGEVWHFEDTGTNHVIFGERRTLLLDVFNQERLERDEDPIPMRYKFRVFKALTPAIETEALARKADENNHRRGNDWLTVAYAVKRQLALGVDPGLVLARWPMIESEDIMDRMAKDSGITAAIPAVQEALAYGRIKLRRALAIADLPLDKQAEALTGKPERQKSEVPKAFSRKSLETLRGNPALNGMSAADLLFALTQPPTATQSVDMALLRESIAEASKPGRKSDKPKPEKTGGLTDEERAETQRMLDAAAAEREAEEAKKNNKRAPTRAVLDAADDEEED